MSSTKMYLLLSCISFLWFYGVKTLLVPVLRTFNQPDDKESHFTHTLKENLIVPHLLPSCAPSACSVIYDPNLIIVTGQQYYYYQIQGVPEVTWEYKDKKYYTLIVLGAFQKKIEYPSTTAPVLRNLSSTLTPPTGWWHQWVIVDIRKNKLEAGSVIQPYLRSTIAEPNCTCKVIYAFVVYEQPKKFNFKLISEEGSSLSNSLLATYFSPISSFEKSFNNCVPVAGNFFQVVDKPEGLVLDTSVVRIVKTGFFK